MTSPPWDDILAQEHYKGLLSAIIIDEAHLVVEWGEDFRPKYKELPNLRCTVGVTPWALITATASKELMQKLLKAVEIKEKEITLVSAVPDRYM